MKTETENNIKVSIIVPVYNAESYLRQCLDSIIGQTLTDIEIICVDDGSTDGSVEILKEYESSDPRVKIYRQQNLFAGTARNNGMSHAKGKYLVFWDSDDFFYPKALEKLYTECEDKQADICICGANRFSEEVNREIITKGYLRMNQVPEKRPFNRLDMEPYILTFTVESAWNKMFLRTFVEEHELRFQARRNGNDLFFTCMALCLAEKITVVEEPLVCYRRQHGNSLVQSVDKDPLSVLKAWVDLKEELVKQNIFPEQSYKNKVLNILLYQLELSHSQEAYNTKIQWLQDEGFQAFDLNTDPEYYYKKRNATLLNRLMDNPAGFLAVLQNENYWRMVTFQASNKILKDKLSKTKNKLAKSRQKHEETKKSLEDANKKIEKLKKKQKKLENSTSYKIGRVITWLPRKLKR